MAVNARYRGSLLIWLVILTWTAPFSTLGNLSPVTVELMAPLSDEDFDGSRLRFEAAVAGTVPAEARVRYLVWGNGQHDALELALRSPDEAFDVSVDWLRCSIVGRIMMIRADVVVPYALSSQEMYGMRSLATAYVEFPLARVFITDAPNVTCDAMPANRATTLAPRELAHEPDAPPFGSRELARALEGVGARMPRSVVGTPSGMADGCTAVLWSRFEYSENAWDAENKVACNAQRAARNVQHATIRRASDAPLLHPHRPRVSQPSGVAVFVVAGWQSRVRVRGAVHVRPQLLRAPRLHIREPRAYAPHAAGLRSCLCACQCVRARARVRQCVLACVPHARARLCVRACSLAQLCLCG
jgi:hypothetical protein